jgi:hypothetical protein
MGRGRNTTSKVSYSPGFLVKASHKFLAQAVKQAEEVK